jgi:hypothetical protein
VLHDKLELLGGRQHGGIDDAFAFTAEIIRRGNFILSFHEEDDLHLYLVETAWELSLRYDVELASGYPFAKWCKPTLCRRAIDWDQRIRRPRVRWQFADRVYERKPTLVVGLDSVGESERALAMDAAPDRSPDLMRLLGEGDSKGAG